MATTSRAPLGEIILADHISYSHRIPDGNQWRTFGMYALVYITEGKGDYWEPSLRLNVQAGDVIIVLPNKPHCYQPNPKWTEMFIVFDGPLFRLWENSGTLNPRHPIIRKKHCASWKKEFQLLVEETKKSPSEKSIHSICRLQMLMSQLITPVKPIEITSQEEWIIEACKLLESSSAAHESIEICAQKMGISYSYFRKRFTKTLGTSPYQHLLQRKIEQARAMLTDSNLTLRQIADQLGFCDEFHFSRRFKQTTGISPNTFRQYLPKSSKR